MTPRSKKTEDGLAERLAVAETDIRYIKDNIADIKCMITSGFEEIKNNHLAHVNQAITDLSTKVDEKFDELSKEQQKMKKFCDEVQENKKHSLSPKEKAAIYVAVIMATGTFLTQLVPQIINLF